MKKPVKPNKPYKGVYTYFGVNETKNIGSDIGSLAELVSYVPEGIDLKDVSLSFDVEKNGRGCCCGECWSEYDDYTTNISLTWESKKSDPKEEQAKLDSKFKEDTKQYKKDLIHYQNEIIKYDDWKKNKRIKNLKKELEELEKE